MTVSERQLASQLSALVARVDAIETMALERDKKYDERDGQNREAVRTAREEQRQQVESIGEKIALGRAEVERQIAAIDDSVRTLREAWVGMETQGGFNDKTIERLGAVIVRATSVSQRSLLALAAVVVGALIVHLFLGQ